MADMKCASAGVYDCGTGDAGGAVDTCVAVVVHAAIASAAIARPVTERLCPNLIPTMRGRLGEASKFSSRETLFQGWADWYTGRSAQGPRTARPHPLGNITGPQTLPRSSATEIMRLNWLQHLGGAILSTTFTAS
jgi:hypothetical protein